MKHFAAALFAFALVACQKPSSTPSPARPEILAHKSAVTADEAMSKCSSVQIEQYNLMQAACAKLDSTDKAQVCQSELEKFKKNNSAINCQASTGLDQNVQIEIAALAQFETELKGLLKK